MTATTRTLGRSVIEVSSLGMGCWAVGGPFWAGTNPLGWGEVDDDESIRTVRRALDLGVTLFDTADAYGTGHSERILGRALADHRDDVVIATKWGNTIDEETRQLTGTDPTPEYLHRAVEGSLHRLGTDHIDLYELHLNDLPIPQAEELLGTLEELVESGKLRWYGWSTDYADRAGAWGREGRHCTAVQHAFSVLHDAAAVLEACETHQLASLNRSPLAMGLLTGKFTASSTLGPDDVRGVAPEWLAYFRDGRPAPEWLEPIAAVREVLTGSGRTLAQGALAWIWARSDVTIPIPGARTVAQVEENAGAMEHGPLSADEFAEVERLLAQLRDQPVTAM
ncbi:aryl-alcohol dehydrogenase-like predicted oxidoreductase [Haloactinopolyspora alba]|uniref:Aryl-alcohol dehydrogenase-like predicted oxidoreductase n=1 Tax=Haloactinopolyspora alba TaxID=648780 RepID=A0A2P8E1A4_9ACTN|nr:aldo/keto reductase [Haloactinopolyspora alba]PSL03246.1 aryl-alcohol dehydrogenase-like predicted oxidoreductase [Haloactinopolyspora alba]